MPKASVGLGNGGIGSKTLRDEDDFARHLDYIHFNPVKHGYAPRVRDWPYSSFRRWVRLAAYPEDWRVEILAIVTKSEAEAWLQQFGDPV